jgi:site-specific recombinase XerD
MIITKEEFLTARQHLRDTVRHEDNPKGLITASQDKNGSYTLLSRYEDSRWVLSPSWFPGGTQASFRILNFECVDCIPLRDQAKVVISRLLLGVTSLQDSKSGGTIRRLFSHLASFLNWLAEQNITSLASITPLLARQYVEYVNAIVRLTGKRKGQPLSTGTKAHKFLVVEQCQTLLRDTPLAFPHPWPESSACALSGGTQRGAKKAKTKVIPDDVLAPVTQYAEAQLQTADALLTHREAVNGLTYRTNSPKGQRKERNALLLERGFNGTDGELNRSITKLRDSCIWLILLTTGIRVHELANIKRDTWFSKEKDGERFYYLSSKSEKTDEGETHWLCPKLTIDALQVLERITAPLEVQRQQQFEEARRNGDGKRIGEFEAIDQKVLLSKVLHKENQIAGLSSAQINNCLQGLVDDLGLGWDIASHQFRRTFARFVVHHKLGDLRYLRDHFKHWSLDMTALYASDENLDMELFDEIYAAYEDKRTDIISHWMEPDTNLSGGLGRKIVALRSKDELVRTYKNRQDMIRQISEQINLRATGIAWCTNDAGGCGSGQCDDCEKGVIDEANEKKWEAIYVQQIELLNIETDVGDSGKKTIKRAMSRCEKVLTDLGADIEKIKAKVSGNA